MLPIDRVKPYARNAKRHPQEQIDEIKASIKRFGMDDPIGIWGKENLIVEGHGRLEACKQLGIPTVPCIRLDHLTKEERKAYTLAHNKTNMDSGWDFTALDQELAEIVNIDMSEFGFGASLGGQSVKKYMPLFIDKAHENNAMIHGLGFTQTRILDKYHFDTVDSSSWIGGQRYGQEHRFEDGIVKRIEREGKRLVNYQSLMVHNFNEWCKFQRYAENHL